jgi:hypothetical protein
MRADGLKGQIRLTLAPAAWRRRAAHCSALERRTHLNCLTHGPPRPLHSMMYNGSVAGRMASASFVSYGPVPGGSMSFVSSDLAGGFPGGVFYDDAYDEEESEEEDYMSYGARRR